MFFNQYPYLNLNDLNLDYVLKTLKSLSEQLENFISLNTIKYANPIQWNITTQYEANTVVIDANDGTAYLSVKPVPTGVAITNTDYWTPIFTLNLLSANQNITFRDDGSNVLATFASDIDDWLIWNNTLYKVSRAIAVNEAYVIGYNLTRYTVEQFVNDYITELHTIIGELSNLDTSDKTSIVNAINEVFERSAFPVVGWTCPELFGAVGDGQTDDSEAILDCFEDAYNNRKTVVFSNVTYGISNTLTITHPIFIEGNNAKLLALNSMTSIININIPDPIASYGRGHISNILIDCDYKASEGMRITHNINSMKLFNIQINDPTDYGIHGLSALRIDGVVMRNTDSAQLNGQIGMYLEGGDNFITEYMAINFLKSLVSTGNGNMFRCNSWNSFPALMKTSVFAELSAWWTFDECVIDTWALGITGSQIRLNNCTFFWSPTYYTDESVGDSTTLPVLFDTTIKWLNNVRVFPPNGRTDPHILFSETVSQIYPYNPTTRNLLSNTNNLPVVAGNSITLGSATAITSSLTIAKFYQDQLGTKCIIHIDGVTAYEFGIGTTPICTVNTTYARPNYLAVGYAVAANKIYPIIYNSSSNRFELKTTETIANGASITVHIEYFSELI